MEKHIDNDTRWDDNELMDCKDIFIKMMDFIRNYDPGTEEYTRRIRFTTHDATNDLAKKLLEIGDLKFYDPKPKEDSNDDMPIRSSGLSRYYYFSHKIISKFYNLYLTDVAGNGSLNMFSIDFSGPRVIIDL